MIGSMYSGISGLKANTSAMEIIGDNIANVSTTGFKASRASFANVFSSSLAQHTPQTGRGAALQSVQVQWDSGSLESTNSSTDFSINGSGLFVVRDGSTNASFYSRAGQFEWDKDGNLVNTDNFVVQGYSIAADGTIGRIDNISLPVETNEPNATENMTFGLNLNSDASDGETFTSSITTYNSLGSEVILDVVFTRDIDATAVPAIDRWNWTVNTDPTTATCNTNGYIAFDNDGNLDPAAAVYGEGSPPATAGNPVINVSGLTGADDMVITWTFLNASAATDGSVTGYSSESTKTAQSQDGIPSGNLQTVSVDEDGYFSGIYSNGSIIPFAQIALADFNNPSGLLRMGDNVYQASANSGQAVEGVAGTNIRGRIISGSLELSNVDLAQEFANMIIAQRGFQANARVITTTDDLLNEVNNLKR